MSEEQSGAVTTTTSADVCPRCGKNHEKIRRLCRASLFATARIFCGFSKMTPGFHGRMAAWVENNIKNGNNKMLVLASRIFYKTSLLTIAGTLWFIIRNPEVRILIVQASAEKVTEIMEVLKILLTSDVFLHYFPELNPKICENPRISDHEILVPRKGNYPEATISARGINSTVTGGHYDIHILDDVIDEKIATSEIEMARAIRWFKNSPPLFTSADEGIRIVVGTRWALLDLYQYIKDIKTHKVWETGCYWDDRAARLGFAKPDPDSDNSIFPEQYPDRALASMREDINDDVIWSFQYLNIPVIEGIRRFEQSMIKYATWQDYGHILICDGHPVDIRSLDIFVTIDPALGRRAESDKYAAVVCGWDRRNARAVVLQVLSGRFDPGEQVNRTLELADKWSDYAGMSIPIGIEAAGYQLSLAHWMYEGMRKRGKYHSIVELKHGGIKKTDRIEALQPYFKNGQVYLQVDQRDLVYQLLNFQPKDDGSTGLRYDDELDALAYHTYRWRGVNSRLRPQEMEDDDIDDWTDHHKIARRGSFYGLNLRDPSPQQYGRRLRS